MIENKEKVNSKCIIKKYIMESLKKTCRVEGASIIVAVVKLLREFGKKGILGQSCDLEGRNK